MGNSRMNIYRASEILKVPERRILDFSNPVNPLGVSKKVKAELRKHLKSLKNRPDPECARMRRHLSRHLDVDMDNMICGNTVSGLISSVVAVLRPQRVLIPVPSPPECLRAVVQVMLPGTHDSGKDVPDMVKYLELKEDDNFCIKPGEFITGIDGCDLAILPNPNNPTGSVVAKGEIAGIASAARDRKCYLLVDETFIDFIPDETVINAVRDNPYLIVLRSISLFHALSGLGLAYSVMDRELVKSIGVPGQLYPVNLLAQRAAVIAMKDKVYKKETFVLLKEEKRFLEREFKKLGLDFFPSAVNFYLIKIPFAGELCDFLMKKYILVRRCDDFRGLGGDYIRIAVKNHRENSVLIKALKEFMSGWSLPEQLPAAK